MGEDLTMRLEWLGEVPKGRQINVCEGDVLVTLMVLLVRDVTKIGGFAD